MIVSKIRKRLYGIAVKFYPWIYRNVYGMDLAEGVHVNRRAHLDTTVNPKGIHIGAYTNVLAGSTILSHDACRGIKADTYIGENCLIGINSIILPGLRIGNQVVIGGG